MSDAVVCAACGTAHAPPGPRFCDACGLALPRVRHPGERKASAEAATEVRCPECGLPATARRCRGCGAKVRWPDDVVPPDEADVGKPAAPALELGDDAGPALELGDPDGRGGG
jgi:hypothetical protein